MIILKVEVSFSKKTVIIEQFSFKDLDRKYSDKREEESNQDHSPFARLQEDNFNNSIELIKVDKESNLSFTREGEFYFESEEAESEPNLALPIEEIQEIVKDSIIESEKSMRVLFDTKLSQEIGRISRNYENQLEDLSTKVNKLSGDMINFCKENIKDAEVRLEKTLEHNMKEQLLKQQSILGT